MAHKSTIKIKINSSLKQPIYKQIIEAIYTAIAGGTLQIGDILPSVNGIAAQHSLARGSVFKAYNELRNAGIIDSTPGKGYFVTNTDIQAKKNIFLLLSTFNPYREVLYNAFINQLKNDAHVDIYFHHHNIKVFDTLIRNHAAYYNTFVIMPEINVQTDEILKLLDPKRVYILDTGLKEFGNKYPCVCQNYEQDIYNILRDNTIRLKKYKRIILLFPDNIKTRGVITGFKKLFMEFNFPAEVIEDTLTYQPRKADLCITMDDNDLVKIMHSAKQNSWTIGKDIGIISYNETPLKSVIAEGITTITSDFEHMGIVMAKMLMNNTPACYENPFLMIDRKSF